MDYFLCVVKVLSVARVTTERCTTTSEFLCGNEALGF